MKVTFFVPVGAQDQDQLKATIKRLFPGTDPTTTERATGTTGIDWQNLDSLADLLNAQAVYSPFIKFTLTDPPEEPSQEQREFLSQLGIEVHRELDPQELLSQVREQFTECEVCQKPEGPFILVEVSDDEGPARWLAVCGEDCLQRVIVAWKQILEIVRPETGV